MAFFLFLLEAKNTGVKVFHLYRVIAVVRIYVDKSQGEIFISILGKIADSHSLVYYGG